MIDLGHSKITELSNGLVEIICQDEFMYDVEHIKENHSALEKISLKRDEPLLVYSIAEKYTGISAEASNYVSKGKHKGFIKAEAFIIHSTTQRLVANLYLKITKPSVPTAYFNNIAEATQWLVQFK